MRSAGRIMPPPPDIPAVPHKALGDAMRRGLVSLNVVERTAALSRTPIARLTLIRAQEVHAFIKAAHRWQPLLTVTALTGLRRSEVCGFRWTDWDPKSGTLTVCRTITEARGAVHIQDLSKTLAGFPT
jgi:integrase